MTNQQGEPQKQSPDDYLRDLRKSQGYMPVGDHFEELRRRLIRIVIYVVLLSSIAALFYEYIWQFLMQPIAFLMVRTDGVPVKIIGTKLTDFFGINIKAVIFTGVLFTIPLIILEIWGFVNPAFEKAGKKWGWFIVIFGTILFWAGVIFCRLFVWDLVAELLVFGWAPPGILLPSTNEIVQAELHVTIGDYLSMFSAFHFAFGVSFEMPVVSVILSLMGILKSSMFIRHWRMAVLIIAIASAVLTPADILSMIAMMIPLMILYVISGFLVAATEKRNTLETDATDGK